VKREALNIALGLLA